jgi:hypothetical protein
MTPIVLRTLLGTCGRGKGMAVQESQKEVKPALLTRAEIEWLQGKKQVSKSFEWKMKSEIKQKLRIFEALEMPLLQEQGFDLTVLSKNLTISSKEPGTREGHERHLSYMTSCEHVTRARRLVRTGC